MIGKLKIWTLLLLLVILSTKCETGGYQIPYVRVDLNLNIISELGNPALNSTTLIDGGANGLIVYREDFGLFHVYDRTCTQYPEHNATVVEDEEFDDILFTCPECKSKYLLLTGADPIEGPATFPLHEYYSRVYGDLLRVYN
ncbi:MAG: hypothetical protein RQ746_01945 [Bacteroidales bacterium]|nr:hypothetical protein [Bacteroidales bacterium]